MPDAVQVAACFVLTVVVWRRWMLLSRSVDAVAGTKQLARGATAAGLFRRQTAQQCWSENGDDPHERDENAMPPILDVLDGGREWRGGCEKFGQSGCYGKQSFAREAGAI